MRSTSEIKKGTILQSANACPTHVFHVHQGLLRSFFVDENGKEHTFMFAPEGWTIADMEATGFEVKTHLVIEAIENSEVERIPIEAIKNAENSGSPEEFQRLLRRAGALQRRILMMMSTSALQRYDFFVATYPDIEQRVSQKLIASYLGITPQALSKIRAERFKNSPQKLI
ncbi:MAG: Crp/Fnr family transcriptional regulator [Flavobacteriales bacterium]